MSSYSRPIFDASDDDEEDDGAPHEAEDDAELLDPSLRSGQAHLDEDDALLEAEFPLGDGVADVTATVWCPYCGEPNEVAVDPGGGSAQEYVEDCAVCCQPWRVTVAYGPDGSASVTAEAADA